MTIAKSVRRRVITRTPPLKHSLYTRGQDLAAVRISASAEQLQLESTHNK